MNISYEGIGRLTVTMPADNCVAGDVCIITAAGAAACSLGGKFCGVVEAVENGMAAVQVEGFVKAKYAGTAPSVGYANLAATGNGGVSANANGDSYLVVAVDTANKQVVIKL